MGEHKFSSDLQYSPAKNQRFRTRDPARNPEPTPTAVKPVADKDRANIMSDSLDTTISMPLAQFQQDVLGGSIISEVLREACYPSEGSTGKSEKPEKRISQAWVNVDRKYGPLCAGHFLHLSEENWEKTDANQYKIDGSLISDQDEALVIKDVPNWALQRLSIEFKRGGTTLDPYEDTPKHMVETGSETRVKVRGQIMSYVQHIFSYQHRTALFFLFVNGSAFRIMLWDRSGVIVSHSTDYTSSVANTKLLLQVIYAFSTLTPVQQGLDPSAFRLSEDCCGWKRMDALPVIHPWDLDAQERTLPLDDPAIDHFLNPPDTCTAASLFEEEVLHADPTCRCQWTIPDGLQPKDLVRPVFTYIRKLFRDSLQPGWPRYQLTVCGRQYLVGKPVFKSSGIVGRGTRGYVALDWDAQRFVFLKDAWRPFYAGVDQEGIVLGDLNDKEVRFVPTLIAHEDVLKQETETSHYSPLTGGKKVPMEKRVQGSELRHLAHYRIVVEQVCLPCTAFGDGKELVKTILHCVIAHRQAFERCDVLHRDVSAGNILIFPTVLKLKSKWKIARAGMLSDWELAKKKGAVSAVQPFRTVCVFAYDVVTTPYSSVVLQGTWPFMSARCLSSPGLAVEIADKVESFTHVLVYNSVRFIRNNIPKLEGFMDAYFDGYILVETESCPPSKRASINEGSLRHDTMAVSFFYMSENHSPQAHPLDKFFLDIFKKLQARYSILFYDSIPAGTSSVSTHTLPLPHSPDDESDDEELNAFGVEDHNKGRLNDSQTAPDRPTQEMRDTAKLVDSHQWFEAHLYDYVYRKKHSFEGDKVADQLPNYRPQDRQSMLVKSIATGSRLSIPPSSSVTKSLQTGKISSTSERKRKREHEAAAPVDEDRTTAPGASQSTAKKIRG